MSTPKKRSLNIGLSKMLSQANVVTTSVGNESLRHIPLELIQPGAFQPRHDFNEQSLQELADSIRSQGILQPIVLRQVKPQQYEIIAGERRWRAAQLAGLATVPAMVKEISNQAALAIGLIENIQREDLNALEEAQALLRLIEEFNLTHEEIAKSVGKSRAMVSNLLRLLQLDDQVKTSLAHGDIEMGHARALLALPVQKQRIAAEQIIHKQLSVRETEKLVKQLLEPAQKKAAPNTKINPNLVKLQETLSSSLGAPVHFQHKKSGAGKLIIDYPNLDVLDGILKKMRVPDGE